MKISENCWEHSAHECHSMHLTDNDFLWYTVDCINSAQKGQFFKCKDSLCNSCYWNSAISFQFYQTHLD